MSHSNRKSFPQIALSRLGIRASFLVSISAMAFFMLVVTLTAMATSTSAARNINNIIDEQLPVTLSSLNTTRAVGALAASSQTLIAVKSRTEQEHALAGADLAQQSLEEALDQLAQTAGMTAAADIISLSNDLTQNISSLRTLVDERLSLIEFKQHAREQLMTNLQSFQQLLTYRIRIVESDSDVMVLLLNSPTVSMEQVAALAAKMAPQIPLLRFYAEIESIVRRMLAAAEAPSLTILAVDKETIESALDSTATTLNRLPTQIAGELDNSFTELRTLNSVLDGLIGLRQRELTLLSEGEIRNQQNHEIIDQVSVAAAQLANRQLAQITLAGRDASANSQSSLRFLLAISVAGLLGLLAFFYFHVMCHLVARLLSLSQSMQMIAAGDYDLDLPSEGSDELGRLGSAVRKFQKMTVEATKREEDLQSVNKELETLSALDGLTSLANRRRFDEAFLAEWARAKRTGASIAVLMLDVDNFKRFNDRYGHQAGDDCLKRVANVLKTRGIRQTDLAARYGGEEFCIVLPHCDIQGAQLVGTQIVQAIEALQIPHEDSPFEVVTISAGAAATIPTQDNNADNLVNQADRALYKAKAAGRNQLATDC